MRVPTVFPASDGQFCKESTLYEWWKKYRRGPERWGISIWGFKRSPLVEPRTKQNLYTHSAHSERSYTRILLIHGAIIIDFVTSNIF